MVHIMFLYIKSLDKLLLEKSHYFPVNYQFTVRSRLNPSIAYTETYCSYKFDNPTVKFAIRPSTIRSISCNLKIPISSSSYCNYTSFYKGNIDKINTITIPQGSVISVPGLLQLHGTLAGNTTLELEHDGIGQYEITMDFSRGTIFSNELKKVEIFTSSDVEPFVQNMFDILQEDLDIIAKIFRYNIIQIFRYNTDDSVKPEDIFFSTKRVFVTSTASQDQDHPENGILNIWIQASKFKPSNPSDSYDVSLMHMPNVVIFF